jgi:hypothetical protein
MIIKEIQAYGRKINIGCDGKCNKAWGINNRPKVILDENNEDDYYFLADNELDTAPMDTGVYEGGHAKPISESEIFNKWCFRECERCEKAQIVEDLKFHDWNKRFYNINSRNQ